MNCIGHSKQCNLVVHNQNSANFSLNSLIFCVCSLPWNQSAPLGYAGEAGFVVATAEAFFIANGATFVLFISICLHHHAFYKIFSHTIDKCKNNKAKHCDSRFFSDLIRFQISIKK